MKIHTTPRHTLIHTHRHAQNTHTSTYYKHSHTHATQTHAHELIHIQTSIHIQTYTYSYTHQTHIYTYIHVSPLLPSKDEEPSPLDCKGLECTRGSLETQRKPISSFLTQTGTHMLCSFLPPESLGFSSIEMETAKLIHSFIQQTSLSTCLPHTCLGA